MVDYTLYYAPTPNGKKVTVMLEEVNASYKIHPVSLSRRDQHSEQYKALNPNSKIPTLVDHTASDLVIFESGAILEYLAEKHAVLLPSPSQVAQRYAVKQWLYWQMGGFGPMLGQLGFFYRWSEVDVPEAKDRYLKESLRLFGVLDRTLARSPYVAGDVYSIADIACYWWSFYVQNIPSIVHQFEPFENVKRWQHHISQRDAVKKAAAIPFNP